MSRRKFWLSIAFLLSGCCVARGQVAVPNASFEQGESMPTAWTLNHGEGGLVSPGAEGQRGISVTGNGRNDNAWTSPPLSLRDNAVYRLQFRARRVAGAGGSAVSGPLCCNRDLRGVSRRWRAFESYFVTPQQADPQQLRLRFGQWRADGQIAFDDVHVQRAIPLYARLEDLELGSGEVIRQGQYTFNAPFSQASANQARPLAWHRCHFNSNRWVFSSPQAQVVYRHRVGRPQGDATIDLQIGWHQRGELVAEVRDPKGSWHELGSLAEVGSASFQVPAELLPADELWIRFTARASAGQQETPSLQLHGYRYEANLEGDPPDLVGETRFLAIRDDDEQLEIKVIGIGDAVPGGDNVVSLELESKTDRPGTFSVTALASPAEDGSDRALQTPTRKVRLAARATSGVLRLPYQMHGTQPHRLGVEVSGGASWSAEMTLDIPLLHAAHYGRALPGSTDQLGIWWCSSGWKVGAHRPVPAEQDEAIVIQAAANETEAAQLVLRARNTIAGLRVQAGDLNSDEGERIPASAVEILRTRYVQVTQPTDATGTIGLWPDPLPPFGQSRDVASDRNFPLWIRVQVPKNQAAGWYRGTITLRGPQVQCAIPLHVRVFGFALPDRMTCKTAFGLSTSMIWRYHGVQTEAERRAVLDQYLGCLSAHHISPYQPAPLDPIDVTWNKTPRWGGGRRDKTTAQTGRYSLRVADNSTTASSTARYQRRIPIPEPGVRLSLWYRSDQPDHLLIVTLQHQDAQGRWMSGCNRDLRLRATTNWQHYEQLIDQFPAGAQSVELCLHATLWSDEGTFTGTTWFDEVKLIDVASGQPLVAGGGFELADEPSPVPEFDFTRWDRAMTKAIDQWHFNTFRLSVPGLGGGTFHARYEPSLFGYGETTRQYRDAMQAYLGRLQEHLRDKGWLDEAFVYWFDEPAPKDYEFVNNGFAKLKRWAPDIPRMLTEQVEPELVGGPNIWCPVSSTYDHEAAERRRAAGEEFWWYVCTGPQAPYCTLFIDHPATEMRVWLWQTWQRDISGILVWQTNYWTSSAAYPDQPQNPYEDPMGWVSGYSTPAGSRRAWGNGDGRFIYPPETAADGQPDEPILAGPVTSIRLEMLRDGLEDYEYLSMLRDLIEEHRERLSHTERAALIKLLDVPPEITADMTTFTSDPAPLEARRLEIARAIERLRESSHEDQRG